MDYDVIGKLEEWIHTLEMCKEMLIEGVSNEPDEAHYSKHLDALIDKLTHTTDGMDWNKLKFTDHAQKATVQLDISLKFARYKKPKKEATK